MHQRIILIETSTSLCSVAMAENGAIVAGRRSSEPRAHAAMTAPYVKEILDERGLRVSDCDAVCLSMGPGSYTGLRVGSSTAKGLCFGGGIPLLAVGTLDVLAAQAIAEGLPEGCRYIVPMIDARRMEVYSAIYTADGQRLTDVAPVVVDSIDSVGIPDDKRPEPTIPLHPQGTGGVPPETPCVGTGCLQNAGGVENIDSLGISETEAESVPPRCINPNLSAPRGQLTLPTRDAGILFIGDGVAKCESVLAGPGRWFRQECPTAEAMKEPALRELNAGNFRDIAYFEPFYLKDFVATVGKKLF